MSENSSFDNDMNDIDNNTVYADSSDIDTVDVENEETESVDVEVIDTSDSSITDDNSYRDNIELDDNISTNEVKNKKSNIGLCIGLVAIAGVIILGITSTTNYFVNKKSSSEAVITVPPEKSDTKITTTDSTDEDDKNAQKVSSKSDDNTVADIVDNVMPSIVSISCTVSQEFNFFGKNYSEDAEGSGSGIIIGQNDKEVLIATNNHVIEGASKVMITFNDGEDVEAEIKGTDSSNDLAVVSVDIDNLKSKTKENIKIATLGKSEKCKVGEMAIAIGNALGYGQSVTVGVISALNREVSAEDYTMSLIQTDAAINPGNSGGALLNSKGEVIGINSVKYVSEDTEGMGYAIPITEAVDILNGLINYEKIPEAKRAYLGIVGYDIDETFSKRSNIPEGIYIQKISGKSPAEEAGMKVGDVIVEFGGKKVSTMENIQSIMKNKKSGDKVDIKVKQAVDGKYVDKTYTVTFGARGDFVKE